MSCEVNNEFPKYKKPLDLFTEDRAIKIAAPMVRYSKLPFRTLVRKYGCDLTHTPMIIADSFIKSEKARDSDFTTNKGDRPLIVQFASNDAIKLATAAEFVVPFSDGVDLNCGCPQRWAMAEGLGASLINKPELVKDMVRQTRSKCPQDFTVSIKIRIHDDISKTLDLCKKAEQAGVSWITVHGRTASQRSQPVNYEAIKMIKEDLSIPVVANGDIVNLKDVETVRENTGVDGVMAARGLLTNPAMYAGYDVVPLECIKDWVDFSLSMGTSFRTFHHLLIDMLEKPLPRCEKRIFNNLTSVSAVLNYLEDYYGITCKENNWTIL